MSPDPSDPSKAQSVEWLNSEMLYYRQRQTLILRDLALALGVITYFVTRLGLKSGWLFCAYLLAAVACLFAVVYGRKGIENYRRRIYYLRIRRAQITDSIGRGLPQANQTGSTGAELSEAKQLELLKGRPELFYPTDPKGLPDELKATRTADIYTQILLIIGILCLVVNLLSAIRSLFGK
jgi:hypothetical protein